MTTTDVLRRLREELANDRIEAALQTVDDLEDSFATDRARTAATDTLATAVRFNSDTDSAAVTAANEHLEAATELEQRRIRLNEAILSLLVDETDPSTVVGRIDAALTGYDALASARQTLQEASDGVSVGALLHLGLLEDIRVPKGGSRTQSTELQNLGSAGTNGLTVSATDDNIVTVALSPTTIDELGAGRTEPIGVDVTGESTGSTRVRVTVEGGSTESTAFRVEVLDKADYISEALSIATSLREDVAARMASGSNSLRGLHNKFSELVRRLEQILDRLESGTNGKGKRNDVDNRIESVRNRFAAIVHLLESDDTTDLDTVVRMEYSSRCRDSSELLETATVANP